jgi:hypothetical protein
MMELLRRLQYYLRRRQFEAELDEEMRHHLALAPRRSPRWPCFRWRWGSGRTRDLQLHGLDPAALAAGETSGGIFPYPAFEIFKKTDSVFSNVFAYFEAGNLNLTIKGQADATGGEYVSGDLLPRPGRSSRWWAADRHFETRRVFSVWNETLAVVILLCAALVAGYAPARRASRIDPMTALRQD